MRAIVIGGGIGGLTAAIALEQVGIEAEIFERAPELREVGAGITLWANALRALQVLNIHRAQLQRGAVEFTGKIRTKNGSVISTASFSKMTKRHDAVFVVTHRAELHAVLAKRVRPEGLHTGHECVAFSQDATGVTATFANGTTVTGDVLIGADGLRSVVRAKLFGDKPPKYSGYAAWRSVVFAPDVREAGESWDEGKRFGIVPLGDGRVYWFAVHNEPEGGSDAAGGGAKQVVSKLFRGWHAPIESLIDAANESSIIRTDICDRDPLPRWSVGRITLLGDAAHPMTPNLGQGACQAIEDGVALAASLATSVNVAESLQRYERRRIPHTSDVVMQSRRIGAIAQWENPLLSGLRDMLLSVTPSGATERALEWIVGHRAVSSDEERLFTDRRHERAALRFAESVEENFRFLERLRFRRVKRDTTMVRYESADWQIVVSQETPSYEVHTDIGPIGASAKTYTIANLVELIDPVRGAALRRGSSYTAERVAEDVREDAALVRECIDAGLLRDPRLVERLEELGKRKALAMGIASQLYQARRRAAAAVREGDFAGVVSALTPLKEYLDAEDLALLRRAGEPH